MWSRSLWLGSLYAEQKVDVAGMFLLQCLSQNITYDVSYILYANATYACRHIYYIYIYKTLLYINKKNIRTTTRNNAIIRIHGPGLRVPSPSPPPPPPIISPPSNNTPPAPPKNPSPREALLLRSPDPGPSTTSTHTSTRPAPQLTLN